MGQEISQQNKRNNIVRRQQQPLPATATSQHQHQHQQQHQEQEAPFQRHHNENYLNKDHFHHTPHLSPSTSTSFFNSSKSSTTTSSSTLYRSSTSNSYSTSASTSSTTTDDYEANYQLRHKYNLTKQTYERTKINKSPIGVAQKQKKSELGVVGTRTSYTSDTDSNYTKIGNGGVVGVAAGKFIKRNLSSNFSGLGGGQNHFQYHQRNRSQSSDSGIYNSSCHCSSLSSLSAASSASSSLTSTSGCPPPSVASSKSLDKQKHYLSHHLYIKSYLDILEEDERARAHFKSARPGGIRNYTPKILGGSGSSSESATLSTSVPSYSAQPYTNNNNNKQQRSNSICGGHTVSNNNNKTQREDPWI